MIYHNILENSDIVLRAMEPEDIGSIYRWENDTSEWIYSSSQTPYSKDVLVKYIANADQDIYTIKQLRLIVELKKEGKAIGMIDLYDFDPNHMRAGIGILIDKDCRRKGYGAQALKLLIQYGFKVLNLHQLFSYVASDNVKSLELFKKNGFEIAGLKKEWIRTPNKWIDEYMLQLVNKNHD